MNFRLYAARYMYLLQTKFTTTAVSQATLFSLFPSGSSSYFIVNTPTAHTEKHCSLGKIILLANVLEVWDFSVYFTTCVFKNMNFNLRVINSIIFYFSNPHPATRRHHLINENWTGNKLYHKCYIIISFDNNYTLKKLYCINIHYYLETPLKPLY